MIDYKEMGRKGGLARAKKYKQKIFKVIFIFSTRYHLKQTEIAKICGVSQSFVSKYTNNFSVKKARIKNVNSDLARMSMEQLNIICDKYGLSSTIILSNSSSKIFKELDSLSEKLLSEEIPKKNKVNKI